MPQNLLFSPTICSINPIILSLYVIAFIKGQFKLNKQQIIEAFDVNVTRIQDNLIVGRAGLVDVPLTREHIHTITTDPEKTKPYLRISGYTDKPKIVLYLPKM